MTISTFSDIELTYVVPVYIENKEAQIIEKFISKYEEYDHEVLRKIHFVLVDDCSPIKLEIISSKLNITIARISDDIPWNQGGARNLGVLLSKSAKLLLTDLDHSFPEETLRHLIAHPIPKHIYNFRRYKNGKPHHPHPNTFFCSKSTFYKSLGVDEQFCGHYGYEDIYFMELQKALKTKFKTFRRHYVSVREHKEIEGESHHNLVRDTKVNEALLTQKRAFLKTKKPLQGHSRITLNFNWKIIKEQSVG
ncbi:glycosyltransferase family 2 protein [Echinicola strongylocentroti]|uniref:Glycosyltransferase family 2 protein n=1 Tax=Echinicola strongylocentroti TaxID=1795355 RepID=A0A2Z4INR4_9BACT|nr:glycosyltransferase [Echinicola strongylocentroti]AWW32399.1 glycosyltransferase family 2 protein [Echinicola strongylocentroti]